MTLLCKESMHLDSHMTTSAGLSCEASENAMVCEMQPKCSEMLLRCGGRGGRRCVFILDNAHVHEEVALAAVLSREVHVLLLPPYFLPTLLSLTLSRTSF